MKIKKYFFVYLLLIFSLTLYSQKESKVINKANALVKEKKYESAFLELDKFDKENNNPEIFVLKQNIVLNYFVTSISHKMFSLKDIGPNEDIMDYRGKEGDSNMVNFDIESSLQKLIEKNPKNYKLNKALADFYYDVLIKYGGNWSKNQEELITLIKKNYNIAIENNAADYMSHYSLGYLSIIDEKYQESIPHFLKSIELDSKYPTSNYNLSVAYLYSDDRQNALKYAIKSYELYTDAEFKSDAARVASQIYYELNDIDNAIKYIELAEANSSKNYNNLKLKLRLYLKKNHPKLDEMTYSFYKLDPSNPTIYNDLEELFYENKMEDKLLSFLNEQKLITTNSDEISGSIYFYLAKIYLDKNKKLVAENALKSKDFFSKVFEKDHEVFSLIDQLISRSEK